MPLASVSPSALEHHGHTGVYGLGHRNQRPMTKNLILLLMVLESGNQGQRAGRYDFCQGQSLSHAAAGSNTTSSLCRNSLHPLSCDYWVLALPAQGYIQPVLSLTLYPCLQIQSLWWLGFQYKSPGDRIQSLKTRNRRGQRALHWEFYLTGGESNAPGHPFQSFLLKHAQSCHQTSLV